MASLSRARRKLAQPVGASYMSMIAVHMDVGSSVCLLYVVYEACSHVFVISRRCCQNTR